MRDVVQKQFEHVRQIHFFIVSLLALLLYLSFVAARDNPNLAQELERLDALDQAISEVAAYPQTARPLTARETESLVVLVGRLNQPLLDNLRSDLRDKLRVALNVRSVSGNVDGLLFSLTPRVNEWSGKSQPVSVVLRDLAALRISLSLRAEPTTEKAKITWQPGGSEGEFTDALVQGFPSHTTHVTVDVRTRQTQYRQLGSDMMVPAGAITTKVVNVPVTLKSAEVIAATPEGYARQVFPALHALPAALLEYNTDQLRSLAKSAKERALTGKSAKVLDIEIQARDIAVVASLLMTVALLYLASFTWQAGKLLLFLEAGKSNLDETSAAAAVWVGTHAPPICFLAELSLLSVVVTCGFAAWFFFGITLVSGLVLAMVTLSAAAACFSLWSVRSKLP